MHGQWQGTERDKSGTLRERLSGWARYVTEMPQWDLRVVFAEGAKAILRDFDVEFDDGTICHMHNGGYHKFNAMWMGRNILRVWLEWSRVSGGFFYEVVTFNGQGERS